MNKVTVMDVKFPPAIGKVEMMSGIRTKDEAISWANKQGYTTVYFLKARERVYADRLTKNVAALAKKIQTSSENLLRLSEEGKGCLEIILLLALVVLIVVAMGKAGIPWSPLPLGL